MFEKRSSEDRENIIETVHSHTLAVELAARLLENGILEPQVLLQKLQEEKAALDSTDKIGITKDGKARQDVRHNLWEISSG